MSDFARIAWVITRYENAVDAMVRNTGKGITSRKFTYTVLQRHRREVLQRIKIDVSRTQQGPRCWVWSYAESCIGRYSSVAVSNCPAHGAARGNRAPSDETTTANSLEASVPAAGWKPGLNHESVILSWMGI